MAIKRSKTGWTPSGRTAKNGEGKPVRNQRMVAENVWCHADKRGFMPGDEWSDWLTGENATDLMPVILR